jgi:hypothetical protein
MTLGHAVEAALSGEVAVGDLYGNGSENRTSLRTTIPPVEWRATTGGSLDGRNSLFTICANGEGCARQGGVTVGRLTYTRATCSGRSDTIAFY